MDGWLETLLGALSLPQEKWPTWTWEWGENTSKMQRWKPGSGEKLSQRRKVGTINREPWKAEGLKLGVTWHSKVFRVRDFMSTYQPICGSRGKKCKFSQTLGFLGSLWCQMTSRKSVANQLIYLVCRFLGSVWGNILKTGCRFISHWFNSTSVTLRLFYRWAHWRAVKWKQLSVWRGNRETPKHPGQESSPLCCSLRVRTWVSSLSPTRLSV